MFRDVCVRYRQSTVLDAVDLTVAPGAVHGLVGESGSGKSTLAAAAVGLVRPAAGSIRLDGTDITGSSRAARRARRKVHLIFQDPFSALDPHLPVGASVAEAMRASERSLSRAGQNDRVSELMTMVDLDPARARELPAAFSGGQLQRITIARALAAEPDVIIADEITSALDVSAQGIVLNLLRQLQETLRLTILFISHNLAVVRYVSDSVSVIRSGHIVESGPAERVLSAPEHPYTQELLDAVPVLGTRPDWDAEHTNRPGRDAAEVSQ